ncbi:MAG TPA: tRNA pseudouridine(54/55) synthase Pus10 [Candidatus Eisenbacteria bacterium]|nr:tRNA pseudouridine(54/55) synthase Pus10 [Candidatus Eisenbacteria bacterium]
MDLLETASAMLEKYALCDHCLGRQFALLGHGVENDERGKSIKLALTMIADAELSSDSREGLKRLRFVAVNGFSKAALETLEKTKKHVSGEDRKKTCFLCEDSFGKLDVLVEKAINLLGEYEYSNFLVGTELPTTVEEREDEFRAKFDVQYAEDLRNEFGRLIGKKIAENNGKPVEFMRPEVVVLTDPFAERVRLQVNPLFLAGRYTKLVRGIPQSKWFCSKCRGKGCEKCSWTGKMYPESVEEFIGKPVLEATGGSKSSFHASGREDIDARMLGSGRPFVIEIAEPKKRSLNVKKLQKTVNAFGRRKVQVSGLKLADKKAVRKLKQDESKQKEYRVLIEFDKEISQEDLRTIRKKLKNISIDQKTPVRVLHRRADLMREKYIYDVNIRKMAPKKAEMKIRCQGGLYVKELVTGDEGRTTPSVTGILNNKAKPLKLDVLKVIMK